MCVFCGDEVSDVGIDPCAVVVVSRWRGPQEQQREQKFFTHAECLRIRLHPDVAPHAEVLDPSSA
jgi:hypothetical protein